MNRRTALSISSVALILIFHLATVFAQTNDAKYSEKIKEYTTDSKYLNELVDHLPLSNHSVTPRSFRGDHRGPGYFALCG